MKKQSKQGRRVSYLVWFVKNGQRVQECTEMLKSLGLDERGRGPRFLFNLQHNLLQF